MAADQAELEVIEGIGPRIAASIADWFARPRNQAVLGKLKAAGLQFSAPEIAADSSDQNQSLVGLSFVITGTLPNLSRNEAKTLIEAAGGKVTGSVTKKTSYLLLGENPGGSKYNKAQTLGTPEITWDALEAMINN